MSILSHVKEGMEVFDRAGDKIGKVEYVYFGETDSTTSEVEAATPSERQARDDSVVDVFAEAFADNDLPEEMRERLQMRGFIKLDTGLLRSDRYVLPEQIAGVSDEAVHLNVALNELVES